MSRHERALLLAARRESLVALAELQRRDLAAQWHGLQPALRWMERGWHWWAFARGHAWVVLVPLAIITVARPRWAARLATGLLAVSRLRRVERWLR
jgi:hypothetical protein